MVTRWVFVFVLWLSTFTLTAAAGSFKPPTHMTDCKLIRTDELGSKKHLIHYYSLEKHPIHYYSLKKCPMHYYSLKKNLRKHPHTLLFTQEAPHTLLFTQGFKRVSSMEVFCMKGHFTLPLRTQIACISTANVCAGTEGRDWLMFSLIWLIGIFKIGL